MNDYSKIELGKKAEQIALCYLKKKDYKIFETNYVCKHGEIDIVAQKGHELVFVEVKAHTISNSDYTFPEEAVNSFKRSHLLAAAFHYLNKKKMRRFDFSFDIIAIEFEEGRNEYKLMHFENALED